MTSDQPSIANWNYYSLGPKIFIVEENVGPNYIGSKKLNQKNVGVKKICVNKKNLSKKIGSKKKFCPTKFLVQKSIGSEKNLSPIKFLVQKFRVKKLLGPIKIVELKKMWGPKKF